MAGAPPFDQVAETTAATPESPPPKLKKIRLFIIEDNRLLRDGLTAMIGEQSDLVVAGALGSGERIPEKIRQRKAGIVLLDLGLRTHSSLALVRSIVKASKEVRVIVMDLVPTQEDVLDFVKAGVSGFILKDATVDEFLKTIRSVAGGAKVLPSNLASSLFSQIVDYAVSDKGEASVSEAVRMTRRERQVIALISKGLANKEIAHQLHLSTYTVKSHVHNILEKLALHSRVQIARYAHTSEDFRTAIGSITLMDE